MKSEMYYNLAFRMLVHVVHRTRRGLVERAATNLAIKKRRSI